MYDIVRAITFLLSPKNSKKNVANCNSSIKLYTYLCIGQQNSVSTQADTRPKVYDPRCRSILDRIRYNRGGELDILERTGSVATVQINQSDLMSSSNTVLQKLLPLHLKVIYISFNYLMKLKNFIHESFYQSLLTKPRN